MSNAEIAKYILIALIGNHGDKFYAEQEYAQLVAESYEIIFNKVKELNK